MMMMMILTTITKNIETLSPIITIIWYVVSARYVGGRGAAFNPPLGLVNPLDFN